MSVLPPPARSRAPRAFTLVEAVVASLVLSIAAVAALRVTAASNVAQYKTAERATARQLGDALMAEILSKAYIEPGPSPVFGPESGETTTPASRSRFDDVDDYHNWSESPPQDPSGAVISGFAGWKRTVSVVWVFTSNLSTATSIDTSTKLITVTVLHNNIPILTRVAVKTNVQ